MIKLLLSLSAALSVAATANAQLNYGLIAHWKMQGNAQDATGNGHDGTMRSVSPATGKDGNPGTALYFNGTTSYIHVPYKWDLNLTQFSICATVKVDQYNQGACQGNYILSRGPQLGSASYAMLFFDNAYNDCATLDTSKHVFAAEVSNNYVASSGWAYSPNIISNTWYDVVTTFDGTSIKTYVNNVLMTTNTITNPTALSSSTDGILIGRMDSTGGYPYPFKGYIDDLRLYNRPLTATEVTQYGSSVLGISNQEAAVDIQLFPNPATHQLTIRGELTGARYQIYDQFGRIAGSGTFMANENSVPTETLRTGIYNIRIQQGDRSTSLRFNRL